jgi:hypothetical protein
MKLTLRELFLLVALVAMGCGWWLDRRQLLTENNRVKEEAATEREQTAMNAAKLRINAYAYEMLIRDFKALGTENASLVHENQKHRLAGERIAP